MIFFNSFYTIDNTDDFDFHRFITNDTTANIILIYLKISQIRKCYFCVSGPVRSFKCFVVIVLLTLFLHFAGSQCSNALLVILI